MVLKIRKRDFDIPKPSSDLSLAELTLKGFIVLPHVGVVLSLFCKLQVADVAFPDRLNKSESTSAEVFHL